MMRTLSRTVAGLTVVLGTCLAWPPNASAQTSSNGAGGSGGGFGLGQRAGGAGSGLGLGGGTSGSTGSFGGLAPGGNQRPGSGAQRPGGGLGGVGGSGGQSRSGGSASGSGGVGKSGGQSIGSELSQGPYAGSRPGGLYGPRQGGPSQAAKLKLASAVASAGVSKQYKYTYGSESLGTKASSVYKSPYKSQTDNYQCGATTP